MDTNKLLERNKIYKANGKNDNIVLFHNLIPFIFVLTGSVKPLIEEFDQFLCYGMYRAKEREALLYVL